jgi:predicted permease
LAAAGCAAGVVVGLALMRVLVWVAPPSIPRLEGVSLDWRVFGVAAAVASVTGLVFGLAPAWQASRAQAAEALKTSARSSATKSQARWRAALTAAEVALSLVLLIGAALLLRSFYTQMRVDLGFRTDRVMAMSVPLPKERYKDGPARLAFFEQLENRAMVLPGVESVAFANRMPMRGGWRTGFFVDSTSAPERVADAQAVSLGYFETFGISLLRGRQFTAEDRGDNPPAVVVNLEFARQFLGGQDPVGHEVLRGGARCRIVGMVTDVRRGGKIAEIMPELYFAAAQTRLYPVQLADFAVRTSGDPHGLIRSIQQQVAAMDRDQPITAVQTMQEAITPRGFRFDTVLVTVFAGIAVLLAGIGIFGVLSFLVSQRMNELGIRVALGASPRRIVTLVLRQAGIWIGAGVTVGVIGALALTRYLESLLFHVTRNDPWTYSAAAALLVAVALAAALIPAARGARADPVKALRYD